MSRLAGIHDLAYCFQRIGGAGSSGYKEDWLGLSANILALGGKAVWYAKGQNAALKKALETVGKEILPAPTAIVDVCMVVVSIVDLFNGFGPPDSGAAFTSGADKLENTKLLLEGAVPDKRDWDGAAAEAYTNRNEVLIGLIESLIKLDKEMQTLVADQGSEIQKAHNAIALVLLGLVVAQGIALALYLIPLTGPAWSCAFQIGAAFAAGAATLIYEMLALSNSMSLAHQIDAKAITYVNTGADAVSTAKFAKIEIAGAEETTVSSFTEISDSLSAFSAAPSVGRLASVAGVAGASSAADAESKLGALAAAEEELPIDVTPEVPETPSTPEIPADPATPAAPSFTLPTMGQVSQASTQAAQISGHMSQHMNLVNQTMGSVQSLASMGQQGQGAAAPAEAALADDVEAKPDQTDSATDEAAGASAGAESGERAPISAAGPGTDHGADHGADPVQEHSRVL